MFALLGIEFFFTFTISISEAEKLIRLRSWKNDYLTADSNKNIYPSTNPSPNNLWRIQIVGNNKIALQNEATKLYLHRPDSGQGVTTWHTGQGNIWTLEGHIHNDEIIKLKSWKTDYLHRDAGNSITTWGTGNGNKWTVVMDSGKITTHLDASGSRIVMMNPGYGSIESKYNHIGIH